ncbi:MAG: hypothetical protein ACJ76T_17790 [Solirubrobacteraceae bacterium]
MRHHVAAAGLLVAVLLVWFHPLLGGDQLTQAHALYLNVPWASEAPPGIADAARSGEGDAAVALEPIAEMARTSVRDGHLPLLNPSVYAGAPLLGDMQSALAFPLQWLMLPLGVSKAWGWIALLRLLIAGLGAYALARRLGAASYARRLARPTAGRPPHALSWGGAMLAGLAYMLCAPNITWAQWPLGTEFALFPWLLLATDRVRERAGPGRIAGLGAAVGLSLLGGHPETILWSSVFAGLYLLVRLAGERRSLWRPLGAFVGGHLLGAVAGGIALVTFAQAYTDSITRSVHELFARAHLPLSAGITYLLPEAFGDGKPFYDGPYLTYQLAAGYVGILILLLAGVFAIRRARDPLTWALGALAALALMVVFAIPPVSWIVRAVPPFSDGNNIRLLYAIALAFALGAGLGLDGLLRRALPLRRLAAGAGAALGAAALYVLVVWATGDLTASTSTEVRGLAFFVVAFALSAAVLWAAGRVRSGRVVAAALLLAVLELAYLQDWNVFLPPDQAAPSQPASISYLRSRPPPFRLSGLWTGLGPPESLPANTAGYYGLESIQGYEFPFSERWSNLSFYVFGERGLDRELPTKTSPVPRGAALNALRMVNVRYYLAPPGSPPPSPALRRVYGGRDATVFADPGALPRAYLVPRTLATTDAAALATLRRGALDPRRMALVPPGTTAAPGGRYAAARARRLDPQRWRVTVPPGSGGWLVFAASWSPLWEATVDGKAVDTQPTDYALVGLPVRAGARTVELRYAATAALWGLIASVVGWLAIVALALVGRVQSRNRT